jgi:hypothetical protein
MSLPPADRNTTACGPAAEVAATGDDNAGAGAATGAATAGDDNAGAAAPPEPLAAAAVAGWAEWWDNAWKTTTPTSAKATTASTTRTAKNRTA